MLITNSCLKIALLLKRRRRLRNKVKQNNWRRLEGSKTSLLIIDYHRVKSAPLFSCEGFSKEKKKWLSGSQQDIDLA
jgi:hypothetical protein